MPHPEAEPAWTTDLRGRVEELLDEYRASLHACLNGLTEDEARLRLVPSKTTLLGLLKHVTYVEGVWFDQAVTGRSYTEIGIASTPDRSFTLTKSDTIAAIQEAHRRRCEASRRTMAELTLDAIVDGRGARSVWALQLQVLASLRSMPDMPTSCASRSWQDAPADPRAQGGEPAAERRCAEAASRRTAGPSGGHRRARLPRAATVLTVRLGVLDVGSNTVHLLVVDAHPGARPWPAYSHKAEMRLAEHLHGDGSIARKGADRLVSFVAEALVVAEDRGVEDLLAFATSAMREAPNGTDVLDRVRTETGADLKVLPGEDEARLTFLAVRRWFGWSSGRLLALDIGGGSLEIASGLDEVPDIVASLPLGAGRLTLDRLPGDPPTVKDIRALRKHVRTEIARHVRAVSMAGTPDRVVGSSKTFRSLARVTGAAPSSEGPYVRRRLRAEELRGWIPKIAEMSVTRRCDLPGVSEGRAPQLLAGALVADAAMDLFGVDSLDISPWALREGVILRRLDAMAAANGRPPV